MIYKSKLGASGKGNEGINRWTCSTKKWVDFKWNIKVFRINMKEEVLCRKLSLKIHWFYMHIYNYILYVCMYHNDRRLKNRNLSFSNESYMNYEILGKILLRVFFENVWQFDDDIGDNEWIQMTVLKSLMKRLIFMLDNAEEDIFRIFTYRNTY